jgi:hypothetical protein
VFSIFKSVPCHRVPIQRQSKGSQYSFPNGPPGTAQARARPGTARRGTTLCGTTTRHAVPDSATVPRSQPKHGPMAWQQSGHPVPPGQLEAACRTVVVVGVASPATRRTEAPRTSAVAAHVASSSSRGQSSRRAVVVACELRGQSCSPRHRGVAPQAARRTEAPRRACRREDAERGEWRWSCWGRRG